MIKFRIANINDLDQLVEVHIQGSEHQPGGFMHKLGNTFLKKYYKIFLSERYCMILVAENQDGLIHGFCSGSLNVEEHLRLLKKFRFSILLSILPALLHNLRLIKEVYQRYLHVNNKNNNVNYNNKKGVRLEFWAWRINVSKAKSADLFNTWLRIAFSFGYDSVYGEVDSVNKHIVLFHKISGAEFFNETILPDGRKRFFVLYTINNFRSL